MSPSRPGGVLRDSSEGGHTKDLDIMACLGGEGRGAEPVRARRAPDHGILDLADLRARFAHALRDQLPPYRADGDAIEELFCSSWRCQIFSKLPQYVVDFRRTLYRADPLIPILGGLSGVGAIVFALNHTGRSVPLAWTALGIIIAIIVASTTIAEPMNSKFRRLPEGQAPDGAEKIRVTWRRFHVARTIAAVAAFALMAAAVAR